MRCPRTVPAAVAVFFAALGAGLFFVSWLPPPPVQFDATSYIALARNVAAGKGFTQDGVTPAMYLPPLFSSLLGGWFFLTGTSSVASATIFQSLVHAVGVIAGFLLFLEITPSLAWATGGALFLAMNPLLVTRLAFVLQEPAILLFTTLAAYLSVRMVKAPSAQRAALTGAAWGFCSLVKIVAWFVPFLLLAMRFLPGRLRWKLQGREAAVLLLSFATVVAPWTLRNYLHSHRFIPVNAQGEGMLEWAVSHAEIPGERPGLEYSAEVYRKRLPEGERKVLLWRYVLDHPRYFLLGRIGNNIVHFAAPSRDWWIATGRARLNEHGLRYWVLAVVFHVPLYLLLLLRSWHCWRGRASPAVGFLVLLYLAYWAQYSLIYGDPRFGIPVYPLLVGIALTSAHSTPR